MNLIFGLTSIGAVGRTIISSVILLSLLVTGHPLSPHNVFIVLTSTSVLKQAVFYYLGFGLQFEAQYVASLCRIQEFLLTKESCVEEQIINGKGSECFPKGYNSKNENDGKIFNHISEKLSSQVTIHDQDLNAGPDEVTYHTHKGKSSICLQDVSCTSDRKTPLLSEINLCITGQRLAVITGPVGSGKFSLLMAMLEELPLKSGECLVTARLPLFHRFHGSSLVAFERISFSTNRLTKKDLKWSSALACYMAILLHFQMVI